MATLGDIFDFFGLPPELRDHIYDDLLVAEIDLDPNKDRSATFPAYIAF
jgi:hypothetical protein